MNRVSDGLFNERGPWGTLGASAIIAKDPYLSPRRPEKCKRAHYIGVGLKRNFCTHLY